MNQFLPSPIEAGKVSLSKIEMLEKKMKAKVLVEGKKEVKTFFRRSWKFFVENRREKPIKVYFHFSLLSRDGTGSQADEFVMEDIPSMMAAGHVYHPDGEDLKLMLESMRIESEGEEIEIVPMEIDLGYTGTYSHIEKTGIEVGKMFGKVSKKVEDYFKLF